MKLSHTTGPHQGQPVYTSGKPLEEAQGALILVHGRGATAQSILPLATELHQPNFGYFAPQAKGNSWYPNSFLAPIESNQPYLSSALAGLEDLVSQLIQSGIAANKLLFAGFSQGACLTAEFVARHPQRYGGLFVFSGGLIGPPGPLSGYTGDLAGTPVFLGCSDVDFHIPKERVLESAEIFKELGAAVTAKLYPNMGHTINADEIQQAQAIIAAQQW